MNADVLQNGVSVYSALKAFVYEAAEFPLLVMRTAA